jgi:hypothetical protein
MLRLRIAHILFLISILAGSAAAIPTVRVSDIIGNPMRYRDVRVQLFGQVTKVEADPLTPNGVIYTLQDESDQVIRVKTLSAPELDSKIRLIGSIAQDDAVSKPYVLEIKHRKVDVPLPILYGAGGALALLALILIYLMFRPKPLQKQTRIASVSEDGPVIERKPVITQVFRDDPVALLVATSGPHKGEVFKLFRGANTIGRDDNQTVQLPDDPTTSRSHARIEANNGSLTILNESATNPTKVDGKDVTERELTDGDIIQIGSTRFRITVIQGA